ncbi:MAG: DoxX family protein [Cyclobacteriaceae bacterium]|jgi:putative oxidoreductase|nr:DoxX family protein [Cyclobacteriaceae bacterium]
MPKSSSRLFDVAMLFLRIPVGFHLIYGVVDNVVSWERMLEFRDFLQAHHFPLPLACAVVSVYAQLLCGLMYILGIRIRVAAAIMIINFTIALIGVHIGDAYPPAFPALIILSSSVVFLLLGGGRWSVVH